METLTAKALQLRSIQMPERGLYACTREINEQGQRLGSRAKDKDVSEAADHFLPSLLTAVTAAALA